MKEEFRASHHKYKYTMSHYSALSNRLSNLPHQNGSQYSNKGY